MSREEQILEAAEDALFEARKISAFTAPEDAEARQAAALNGLELMIKLYREVKWLADNPEPLAPFDEAYYTNEASDAESALYENWITEHRDWEELRQEATS